MESTSSPHTDGPTLKVKGMREQFMFVIRIYFGNWWQSAS